MKKTLAILNHKLMKINDIKKTYRVSTVCVYTAWALYGSCAFSLAYPSTVLAQFEDYASSGKPEGQNHQELIQKLEILQKKMNEKTREMQNYKAHVFRPSHPDDVAKMLEMSRRIVELQTTLEKQNSFVENLQISLSDAEAAAAKDTLSRVAIETAFEDYRVGIQKEINSLNNDLTHLVSEIHYAENLAQAKVDHLYSALEVYKAMTTAQQLSYLEQLKLLGNQKDSLAQLEIDDLTEKYESFIQDKDLQLAQTLSIVETAHQQLAQFENDKQEEIDRLISEREEKAELAENTKKSLEELAADKLTWDRQMQQLKDESLALTEAYHKNKHDLQKELEATLTQQQNAQLQQMREKEQEVIQAQALAALLEEDLQGLLGIEREKYTNLSDAYDQLNKEFSGLKKQAALNISKYELSQEEVEGLKRQIDTLEQLALQQKSEFQKDLGELHKKQEMHYTTILADFKSQLSQAEALHSLEMEEQMSTAAASQARSLDESEEYRRERELEISELKKLNQRLIAQHQKEVEELDKRINSFASLAQSQDHVLADATNTYSNILFYSQHLEEENARLQRELNSFKASASDVRQTDDDLVTQRILNLLRQ